MNPEKRAKLLFPPKDDKRVLLRAGSAFPRKEDGTLNIGEAKGSYEQTQVAQVVVDIPRGGQPPRPL